MTNFTYNKQDSSKVNLGYSDKQSYEIAQSLSNMLASNYILYLKSLYYHWNVTGINFSSLHELFEKQYEDLHKAGDEIAERIRALGRFAPGTYKEFSKISLISEDDELPSSAEQMIKNSLYDNEECSKLALKVLRLAEEYGDEVTQDLMVSRMQSHDKTAWMLRSCLG